MKFGKVIKNKWTAFGGVEEIDFSKDLAHWETLTDKEKYFIKMVLAFLQQVMALYLKIWYAFFKRSSITRGSCDIWIPINDGKRNSETYSLLIDTYIKKESEKRIIRGFG